MSLWGDVQGWRNFGAAMTLVGAVVLPCAQAAAQGSAGESLYAGKTIDMIIGFSAGGGYDRPARLLAQFMEGHLPGNPTIVPRNMPGGGSRTAAGYVYNVAPKDGTVLATIDQSLPLQQALGEQLQFDAAKFTWVGNLVANTNVLGVWSASGVKTIEDAKRKEVTIGATGSGSSQQPKIMNVLLGTKFKIILGYPGGSEINLAIERGEVMGRTNTWASFKSSKPDWIRDGKINILVQIGLSKASDLPDVPLLMDLGKTAEDRAMLKLFSAPATIGRPIVSTPGLPGPTVKILHAAFSATVKDPAFLKEAKKEKIAIEPMSGADLQAIVAEVIATPRPIAEKLHSLLGGIGGGR
jgi:tripartite-type tricarboxylate transporter receptor subunit TctC